MESFGMVRLPPPSEMLKGLSCEDWTRRGCPPGSPVTMEGVQDDSSCGESQWGSPQSKLVMKVSSLVYSRLDGSELSGAAREGTPDQGGLGWRQPFLLDTAGSPISARERAPSEALEPIELNHTREDDCTGSRPKRKRKFYHHPVPSKHCHICARTVHLMACSNIRTGTCLKVTCKLCFDTYGLNWEQANHPESDWTCTHCRNECPSRARCYVYTRAVESRRRRNQARKRETMVFGPPST
mmetsp:Transcript_11895/g.24233  ORF Transcript_11895/g.24233 Transcript_11895/m.24233 type:complete len:240 (-) Transcript_11895:487-1206(-)